MKQAIFHGYGRFLFFAIFLSLFYNGAFASLPNFKGKLVTYLNHDAALAEDCSEDLRPFITTWKTDYPGTSSNKQIIIPTTGSGYNYTVSWVDVNDASSTGLAGPFTGTDTINFPAVGTYQLSITGDFPRLFFNNQGDKEKILRVDQWGDNSWMSMQNTFYGCSNLIISATDAPDLRNVTDMSQMFRKASSFDQDISSWDVSNVTSMSNMFREATSFNQDIGSWDVSSVVDMSYMFYKAVAFNGDLSNWEVDNVALMTAMFQGTSFDQDISSWEVGNVTNMSYMFLETPFNRDIGSWEVGNVTNMLQMFYRAESFNQDIGSWDVSNVTSMSNMFREATSFNQDIGSWDVSSVVDMSYMFYKAEAFNGDLSNWEVDNVALMTAMFQGTSFDQDISSWEVGNVTNMSYMFLETPFNRDIGSWEVGNVTNMLQMFYRAESFNQDIGSWDVSNVTSMSNMFREATSFNQDIGSWDVSSVVDMSYMFYKAGAFNGDLSNWEVDNVALMTAMFQGTSFDQDISSWEVGNVTNMSYMFLETPFNRDIGSWEVGNVTNMLQMFYRAESFNQDIGSWDVSNVTSMSNMFREATSFNQDIGSWDVSSVVDMSYMFYKAEAFNGDLSNWEVDNVALMTAMFQGTSFDQDISSWEVGNVTNMSYMFLETPFNRDIGSWEVGNVTNMLQMFYRAESFNQDIGSWDVSNVTSMSNMFREATSFNQDIGSWDVSSVVDMSYMFYKAEAFNGDLSNWEVDNVALMTAMFQGTSFDQDISSWEVGNVTNMSYMFLETPFNRDIGSWEVGNVTNMLQMFYRAESFNQDIGSWDVSNVTSMSNMFREATSFNQDIGGWDVSSVVDMSYMFYKAEAFNGDLSNWEVDNVALMTAMFQGTSFDQDISSWEVGNVTNMSYMFLETPFNRDIGSWEVGNVTNMLQMFYRAESFNQDIGSWDVSNVTSMSNMFREATSFNQDIGGWDVSSVVDMSYMFYKAEAFNGDLSNWEVDNVALMTAMFQGTSFDQDISSWEVGNVTNMSYMFLETPFNRDIGSWEVGNVTNMLQMFYRAESFNQDIGSWDVSNVTSMSNMFREATSFNQDIGGWDVSSVVDMSYMFYKAEAFNGDLSNWEVGNVALMTAMFQETSFNQDIGSWDVSNVTGMSNMFRETPFNKDINDWEVDNVTNMALMFYRAGSFNQDIGSWDVSNVTSMYYMFREATSFNQDIGSWDVSSVVDMSYMFYKAGAFNRDLSNWEVGNVALMTAMFQETSFNQDIGSWDVSNVTSMSNMFRETPFNKDINDWEVVNVTNMALMFYRAGSFNQDIGSWDVSNVTSMYYMFREATSFNQDIGSWDVSSVVDMSYMFYKAGAFNRDLSNWEVGNVALMTAMFQETSFNQDIGSWDVSNVTSMSNMFRETPFNKDINDWEVVNVTNMALMFYNAKYFNQNLSSWDVSNVTSMSSMFYKTPLSVENYDATLAGWASLPSLQLGITLGADDLIYCDKTAREVLTDIHNWIILGDQRSESIECLDFYPPPSPDENYIRVEVPRVAVASEYDLSLMEVEEKTTSYSYYDGLGRLKQEVTVQGSPLKSDVRRPVVYDGFGRQATEYLPYVNDKTGAFKSSALTDIQNFYSSATKIADDTRYYTEHTFDNSPLNRVMSSYMPGEDWYTNDKDIENTYRSNGDDEVAYWTIDVDTDLPESNSPYGAGQLWVTEVTSEDDQVTQEFTNKRGEVVLKRVLAASEGETDEWYDTYYVYDDFGNLRFVVPPRLAALSLTPSSTQVHELGFAYTYDKRQRMVEKYVPGADPVYMVYDQWDRLVMTQDGVQRVKNSKEWTYTKYDHLNRPIVTGIVTNNDDREDVQEDVNADNGRFESVLTNDIGYTLTNSFPRNAASNDILTITYYDAYDFASSWGSAYGFTSESGFDGDHEEAVKGHVTGGQVAGIAGTLLKSVTYYDHKYRPIQVINENHIGGTEKITTDYDFIGNVVKTKAQHTSTTENIAILNEYEYDHANRLIKEYSTINDEPRVLVASNAYNELGELVEKNLHSENNGSSYLQSVDYRYNIRGWLTDINNHTLSSDGTTNDDTNDDTNDLFGMRLSYNQDSYDVNGQTVAPLYSGNIAGIKWQSSNLIDAATEQAYAYEYDKLSRLTAATYGSGASYVGEEYHSMNASYDENGNIMELSRKGKRDDGTLFDMDILRYEYFNANQSNRLYRVDDDGDDTQGYKEIAGIPGQLYYYDENGNMTADVNKEIESIAYNNFNLPSVVTFDDGRKVTYDYDGTGAKLRKTVLDSDGDEVNVVDYVPVGQYEDGDLSFLFTSEGRALRQVGRFHYEYFLKDHLGNNRVSFGNLPETHVYTADMENGDADSDFAFPTTEVRTTAQNHTSSGAQSASLNGRVAGREVGPARVLTIQAGDEVELSVWSKYEDAFNAEESIEGMVSLVASAFGTAGAGTGVEGASGSLNTALSSPADASLFSDNGETEPRAYLQYLFFDASYSFEELNSGYQPVTAKSLDEWAQLESGTLTFSEAGYLFVYIANETDADAEVYFDDLQIIHRTTSESVQVSQVDDYYPFGGTFNQYERTASTKNDFKFNQGFGKKTFQGLDGKLFRTERIAEIGLDMTKLRLYDYSLGRFVNVDPLAETAPQESWTPYQYAYNNPVRWNDPYGDCAWCKEKWAKVVNFTGGVANAVASNSVMGAGRQSGGTSSFQAGQALGDRISLVQGAAEIALGAVIAGGGGAATVGTAGAASPISVPATAAGVVVATHGVSVAGTAMNNLNSEGSSDGGGGSSNAAKEQFRDAEPASPALNDNPYSPREVSKRQSQTRRERGVEPDPDVDIPDQPSGRNLKGSHTSTGKDRHSTGERNVSSKEEHSRVPKGNRNGAQRN